MECTTNVEHLKVVAIVAVVVVVVVAAAALHHASEGTETVHSATIIVLYLLNLLPAHRLHL